MTTAAQRTPVSLLFSFCTQNGLTAEYELTSVEGASHDPTFTYRVKVQDIEATASGHSKRKAKHSAAKIALEQLLSKPDISEKGFNFEDIVVTAKTLDDVILEPVGEKSSLGCEVKNAIGILQEYCTKKKTMPPYYETIHEEGPPHDKIFIVQCMVTTDHAQYTTEAEGKTKRIGKRIAAELMLEKLQVNESSEEKPKENEISEEKSKENETSEERPKESETSEEKPKENESSEEKPKEKESSEEKPKENENSEDQQPLKETSAMGTQEVVNQHENDVSTSLNSSEFQVNVSSESQDLNSESNSNEAESGRIRIDSLLAFLKSTRIDVRFSSEDQTSISKSEIDVGDSIENVKHIET